MDLEEIAKSPKITEVLASLVKWEWVILASISKSITVTFREELLHLPVKKQQLSITKVMDLAETPMCLNIMVASDMSTASGTPATTSLRIHSGVIRGAQSSTFRIQSQTKPISRLTSIGSRPMEIS